MRLRNFRECNKHIPPKGEYYGKSLTQRCIIWICRILVTRRASLILNCQPPWAFSGMQNCDHRHCSGDVRIVTVTPSGMSSIFPSFVALQTPWDFVVFSGLVQRLWDALLPRRCQVQVAPLFVFFEKREVRGHLSLKACLFNFLRVYEL